MNEEKKDSIRDTETRDTLRGDLNTPNRNAVGSN